MKKLLALCALLFSTSMFANTVSVDDINQFNGKYVAAGCYKGGDYYYRINMKITVGEHDHYGQLIETHKEYSDRSCDLETDRSRKYVFDYTLFPTDVDGIYEFNVYKEGEQEITFYDIIGHGKYKGKVYLFFGKGGPAKNEDDRPTEFDARRRFIPVR